MDQRPAQQHILREAGLLDQFAQHDVISHRDAGAGPFQDIQMQVPEGGNPDRQHPAQPGQAPVQFLHLDPVRHHDPDLGQGLLLADLPGTLQAGIFFPFTSSAASVTPGDSFRSARNFPASTPA